MTGSMSFIVLESLSSREIEGLFPPVLDAAVIPVQAQAEPVPAGGKPAQVERCLETDMRMLRIRADPPVRTHVEFD
ncbi:hypothetical protein SB773_32545, partial [Bacillus sp. SIMBA_074]